MDKNGLILIVDDNPNDVRIYRRLLERSDSHAWQVADVSTGEEGLAFLSSQPVACVLLDYRLPDMDGLEFLSQLNQLKQADSFPVILLTGQGDEQVAVQAMKSHAADYLIKGALSKDLLFRAISHAVAQNKRQMEQKRYHAFLKILIDTVPNPLFFKDRNRRFSGCNKAFEVLVGRTRPDIIGSTGYDLFDPDLYDGLYRMEDALIRENAVQSGELIVPDANGRLLNMICFLADFREIDSDQEGLLGIMLDITSQKRTEAELRQTQTELEATVSQLRESNRKIIDQHKSVIEEERLKILLQMAGATAQELNQPLMVLLGSIELMRGELSPDAGHLERIETAGREVAKIIHKIQQIRNDQISPYTESAFIREMTRPMTVLAVEDDGNDLEILTNFISEAGGHITLVSAATHRQAFDLLLSAPIDLILLDHKLSDGTGLEFLESVRQKGLEIPVVIVTGYGDEVIASQSIQAGAYDYLPKDRLTAASLKRVIANTMEKHRYRREMKIMMEKMASMARRDELTGLYNRRYFNESLPIELEKAKRYDRQLTLAIFDLDHFKNVNDLYGHPAGDLVLKETGKLILQMIRQCDIACRYGGEEIAVIMPDTGNKSGLTTCQRILDGIRAHTLEFEGKRFSVTASAGVASFTPVFGTTPARFIQTADRLLYEAKALGRNQAVAGDRI